MLTADCLEDPAWKIMDGVGILVCGWIIPCMTVDCNTGLTEHGWGWDEVEETGRDRLPAGLGADG